MSRIVEYSAGFLAAVVVWHVFGVSAAPWMALAAIAAIFWPRPAPRCRCREECRCDRR